MFLKKNKLLISINIIKCFLILDKEGNLAQLDEIDSEIERLL
jgi:hypothetical protein